MSILIGCSPSTGSSLLRRMLHRHSQIFCGSETALFAKQQLYLDWNKYKVRINRPSLFGLSNAGWHNLVGVQLGDDYSCDKNQFRQLIKSCNTNFVDFAESLYRPILEETNKTVWLEKTPSNAFTLSLFLETFPQGKAIHIVRHPLDAISSLYNRGMSLYNAVAVYLLNTSKALAIRDNENSYLIRYEDLVNEPEDEMRKLLAFIGLAYESQVLDTSPSEGRQSKMTGWIYDETAAVQQGSINRFESLESSIRNEILSRIHYVQAQGFTFPNIAEIAKTLDYTLAEDELDSRLLKQLKIERAADIKSRHFSRAHFRAANYPITFSDELV